MADYYEHMSVVIPLAKPHLRKKLAWWKKARESLELLVDGPPYPANNPNTQFLLELGMPEETENCSVCYIQILADCVLLTDDGGVLHTDGLAALLQAYLAEFDPDGYIAVEIAFTCSKPRPDGFGGYAMVVTSTDWKGMTLGDAVDQLRLMLGKAPTQQRNTR